MQTTAAAWLRRLVLVVLLSPTLCLAQSDTAPLVIGGNRAPQPDRLELLLELPTGTAKLQPREIQLLEDARATARASAVNGFRNAGWIVSTVLAIDTSGSMKRYLGPVRSALPDFVAKLQPNDTLALITFDDDVHVEAPFGAPRDQLAARIGKLSTVGSKTLLHKALDQSLTMLEGRSADRTRRRTLVISDGSDESSGNPSVTDDIIRRAVRLNVAIDTIWLGQPVAARRDTLVRFAERSGGVHRDAIKADSAQADVKAALNDINDIATNAVIASFERQIQTDASTREIGVSLARPGIAAATVPLQIPRSAVPGPAPTPNPPSRRDLIVRWTIRLLPALPAAYGAYVLLYLAAKKRNPNRRLLNPIPWVVLTPPAPLDIPPAPLESPKPSPSRRVTMVAPERSVAGANGIAHGLALDAVDGPLRGQRIAVVGPRFQIGADNNNELRITTDKYLSGMHARIEHSKGQWTLIDQGSSNGTFVNGRRLTGGQAHPLHNGESVRIGTSEFRIMLAPVAAAAAAAPASDSKPAPATAGDERPR
jgi:Mg-chelatase subunit ChlD